MAPKTCVTLAVTAFFCAVAAHAVAAAGAPGTIRFGVADDAGKYADDSGAQFYSKIAAGE